MSITIFTDGSSRGNPGPGGWGAIIRTGKEVKELGGREDYTTNNRMELSAAINALIYVDENINEDDMVGGIVVQSDSKYVIKGITEWVSGWQRNGWITAGKKEVENRDLWEALVFATKGLNVAWKYVEGHAGHPGNERCDEIATSFADNVSIDLYHGVVGKYPIDLDAEPTVKATKKKSASKGLKAYSYVSCVDGVIETHKTWAECEARVKGKSGAKFKKALNKEDEAEISSSFL